ncbi:hypothetical protein AB0I98_03730 [Streptomyces sp. NPDC050211]
MSLRAVLVAQPSAGDEEHAEREGVGGAEPLDQAGGRRRGPR